MRTGGRGARPWDIVNEEGGHGPLLRLKRLLEPRRACPPARRLSGGHHGHMLDLGGGPTQQSDHGKRQAPTVTLQGLAGKSRVHGIPCWWTIRSRLAGHRWGNGRSRVRRERDNPIRSLGSRPNRKLTVENPRRCRPSSRSAGVPAGMTSWDDMTSGRPGRQGEQFRPNLSTGAHVLQPGMTANGPTRPPRTWPHHR
jgi:hypothetical protein